MPRTEAMRSAWNSPWPPGPGALSAASSRQLRGITKTAHRIEISVATRASSSSRSAPATRSFSSPNCQIARPAAAP